jgi:hypothetical protein
MASIRSTLQACARLELHQLQIEREKFSECLYPPLTLAENGRTRTYSAGLPGTAKSPGDTARRPSQRLSRSR